jgi:hypothetical protein
MTNKEYAIKQLQELPDDQDAFVIIFTKDDADAAVEGEDCVVTEASWANTLRACEKAFPNSEMWDGFTQLVLDNAEWKVQD